ncbi:hypothetical protein FLAV_02152 [Flavobacteriales bacterium]|nr:Outer membrane protein assembly factor BamB [Flavobacteriales bacterium]WKZ75204.1 MAG: PQQ-binding-like beta-propeller repeat protein [Vicingaceae bacterium]CAG0988148.1 hypothetical protein FLAV_02152 [Flavobacteriales bacterium]
MKNKFIATVITYITIHASLFCQPSFQKKFESTFPVNTKWRVHNNKLTIAIAGDLQELAGIDLITGKLLWSFSFKDKLGIKKVNDWNLNKDNNVVTIKYDSDIKGKEITKWINAHDGNILDENAYAEIKTNKKKNNTPLAEENSKKEYKTTKKKGKIKKTSLKHNGNLIQISFDKKLLTGAIKAKNTKATITCSGKSNWTKEIDVQVIRPLCSISFSSSMFGEDFLEITAYKDKLFVLYEGITVMDINSGDVVWSAGFSNSYFDFGIFKSVQELGRAAWPLPHEDFVYVVDLNDYERCIKKLDINTGALIWRSEKFSKGAVIPELLIEKNILLVKCGGKIEKQSYIPGVEGRPDVCKKEFKYSGDFGLKALDINTGKTVWQTFNNKELEDKFSSQITNMLVYDSKVYIGSDKNIFCFESSNGKVLFKIKASDWKIGKPYEIWDYDEQLIIQSEKGLSSINLLNGSQNWVTKTKLCLSSFFVGDAFFVINGKSEEEQNAFIRLDINSGKILGNITKTTYPYFTEDGEEFIKYDGQKVLRYKTQ